MYLFTYRLILWWSVMTRIKNTYFHWPTLAIASLSAISDMFHHILHRSANALHARAINVKFRTQKCPLKRKMHCGTDYSGSAKGLCICSKVALTESVCQAHLAIQLDEISRAEEKRRLFPVRMHTLLPFYAKACWRLVTHLNKLWNLDIAEQNYFDIVVSNNLTNIFVFSSSRHNIAESNFFTQQLELWSEWRGKSCVTILFLEIVGVSLLSRNLTVICKNTRFTTRCKAYDFTVDCSFCFACCLSLKCLSNKKTSLL